jgi:hypothetical protein
MDLGAAFQDRVKQGTAAVRCLGTRRSVQTLCLQFIAGNKALDGAAFVEFIEKQDGTFKVHHGEQDGLPAVFTAENFGHNQKSGGHEAGNKGGRKIQGQAELFPVADKIQHGGGSLGIVAGADKNMAGICKL